MTNGQNWPFFLSMIKIIAEAYLNSKSKVRSCNENEFRNNQMINHNNGAQLHYRKDGYGQVKTSLKFCSSFSDMEIPVE